MVIAELRQRSVRRAVQHLAFALGGDARDRFERTVANDRQHHIQQLGRHGVSSADASAAHGSRCGHPVRPATSGANRRRGRRCGAAG